MRMLSRLLGFGARPLAPQDAYALWAETYPARPHNPLMELSTNAPSRSTTTSPLRGGVSTPRTRESNRIEVATPSRAATRALTSATRFFQLSIGWQAPLDA